MKTSLLLLDKPSESFVQKYIHLVPMSHSAETLWQHLRSLLKQCMHSPRKTIHLAGEKKINGYLYTGIFQHKRNNLAWVNKHTILVDFYPSSGTTVLYWQK